MSKLKSTIKGIATSLRDNSQTTLSLHRYKMGDEETKNLALGLKENTSLTVLDLSNNKIGDKVAKDLALALEYWKCTKERLKQIVAGKTSF